MELVEAVPGRLGEGVGIRKGLRALVDEGLDMLGEEPLGLLAGLPHVENPEHSSLVVEARRVCDQTLERPVADLIRHQS